MASLQNLPIEVIIYILQLAAWPQVITQRGWVAALCTVCRSSQRPMARILYDLVRIDWDNVRTAVATAKQANSPFGAARAVFITERALHSPKGPNASDYTVLTSVFTAVRSYTGTRDFYDGLLENARPPLSTVFLTDAFDSIEPLDYIAFARSVASIKHLHLTVTRYSSRFPPSAAVIDVLRAEYLILDVYDMTFGRETAARLALFLGIRTLRRLLVRARSTRADFHQHMAAIGAELRDSRLWLYDQPIVFDCEDAAEKSEWDDTLAGESLWFTGHQLFVE